MKKKIMITLLAVCMTALFTVPAFAATPNIDFGKYIDLSGYIGKFTLVNWHWNFDNTESEGADEPEATEYTIEYDCNGGFWFNIYKSPAYSSSATSVIEAGDTHKVMSKPTRGGYTFQGWVDENGNVYKAGGKITPEGDMKLTASWKYNG